MPRLFKPGNEASIQARVRKCTVRKCTLQSYRKDPSNTGQSKEGEDQRIAGYMHGCLEVREHVLDHHEDGIDNKKRNHYVDHPLERPKLLPLTAVLQLENVHTGFEIQNDRADPTGNAAIEEPFHLPSISAPRRTDISPVGAIHLLLIPDRIHEEDSQKSVNHMTERLCLGVACVQNPSSDHYHHVGEVTTDETGTRRL